MSIWRGLQQIVDLAVDGAFAEPVRLVPWKAGSYTSQGAQDPARAAVDTTGICVRPGAAVSGEGGTQGAALNMRMVMQDVWLSITEDKAINWAAWVKGDRVFFPERNEWYEIAFPDPSATSRPNLHLIRIQAGTLMLGGRLGAEAAGEEPEDSLIWNDESGAYVYDPDLKEVVNFAEEEDEEFEGYRE